jgi:hypothetical protein
LLLGDFDFKKTVDLDGLSLFVSVCQSISLVSDMKIAWPPLIDNVLNALRFFNLDINIFTPVRYFQYKTVERVCVS